MKARKILVLNGPNLDMLGVREPEVYGHETLETLEDEVRHYAERRGVSALCFQSNSEGELVSAIHEAADLFDGIVYNPGAHTHYSYALRDAVGSIDIPVVEVHLSDISKREDFRRTSVIAPACIAQVRGMGIAGYCRAIDILCDPDDYERLGEGFEEPAGTNIAIGPKITQSGSTQTTQGNSAQTAPSSSAQTWFQYQPDSELWFEPQPQPDSQPAFKPQPQPEPQPADLGSEEYVAAVAEAIASIDVGQLSYERQVAVRKMCEKLNLIGLLVRDTSNIRWLTGFDGVFDDEAAHALLVAGGGAILHTDSRYSNAARTVAQRIESDIMVNDERINHARFAYNALTAVGTRPLQKKLGIEDAITYAEFVKMVEYFGTNSLAPTSELVLGLRAVKDVGEIARLRAAQAVTDAAFSHIVAYMRPGMTEREVQRELEDYLLRHGAEGLAFQSIVAAGANAADPHSIPGNTRLEAGQCVVMDFGARVFGYCADMTRTVFLGAPDREMRDAWDTIRNANETVESYLKPGVTGASAHELAEQILAKGGFGGKMGHGLGHGVGLDVHELPSLNPRSTGQLVPGNVVTVEPGIYIPGQFGMRLEDFGVVTETGFDVFTQSTHEMVII